MKKLDHLVGKIGTCVDASGIYALTHGKEYEIVGISPGYNEPGFRTDDYLIVINDFGRKSEIHAYRMAITGESNK